MFKTYRKFYFPTYSNFDNSCIFLKLWKEVLPLHILSACSNSLMEFDMVAYDSKCEYLKLLG